MRRKAQNFVKKIRHLSAKTGASGASSGNNRVQRGGSWYNNANNCKVANRNNNNPNNRNNNYGFRLVRSAQLNLETCISVQSLG